MIVVECLKVLSPWEEEEQIEYINAYGKRFNKEEMVENGGVSVGKIETKLEEFLFFHEYLTLPKGIQKKIHPFRVDFDYGYLCEENKKFFPLFKEFLKEKHLTDVRLRGGRVYFEYHKWTGENLPFREVAPMDFGIAKAKMRLLLEKFVNAFEKEEAEKGFWDKVNLEMFVYNTARGIRRFGLSDSMALEIFEKVITKKKVPPKWIENGIRILLGEI